MTVSLQYVLSSWVPILHQNLATGDKLKNAITLNKMSFNIVENKDIAVFRHFNFRSPQGRTAPALRTTESELRSVNLPKEEADFVGAFKH